MIWAATIGLAVAIAVAGAVWARRAFVVVTVDGFSMLPSLRHGDRVLVRRRPATAIGRGDVVVLRRQSSASGAPVTWLIKRVAAVPGDPVPRDVGALRDAPEPVVPEGRLVLLGDNPQESFDSREHGYYPAHLVLGVVARRMPGAAVHNGVCIA